MMPPLPWGTVLPDVMAQEPEVLLAAGWGEVPRHKIPANWRERRGPESRTPAQREAIQKAQRANLDKGRRRRYA